MGMRSLLRKLNGSDVTEAEVDRLLFARTTKFGRWVECVNRKLRGG